jgi:hypothetical protein
VSASPNLKLPYLDQNQNQKTVTHNAALRMLDALVQLQVQSSALAAPPASPGDGQCWIVASGGSGAWQGKDLNVAAWQDGAWMFYAPTIGMLAYNDATASPILWTGSAWAPFGGGSGGAVTSVAGRTGAVTLGVADVGGAAPLASPALSGTPTAPTPTAGDNTTKLATTAFVAAAAAGGGAVTSVAGRTGAVTLAVADVGGAAPLASPALSGTPTAPTPTAGDSTTKLATTGFVAASFLTAAAAGSTYAPLASPVLTGTPQAPTPAAGDSSGKIATTGFVTANFVTYAYAGANYATSANASLTGTPTAPTQPQNNNSTRIATTAYADRAAAAIIGRTQVSDAAYAVLATDRTIAVTALTAARTLTLPAASAYPAGATLTVVDESGACSATSTVTIAAAGTDTVNGAASAVLSAPNSYLALESNTANKWTVIDQPSGVVSGLNGGPLAGFRNRVIDGNFAINQRGQVSGTALAAAAYGHDRWKAGASGCTYTFAAATPDTLLTVTAGTLTQVIEAANVEGGTYTLSWTGTATARVYQGTAAGSYVASPLVVTGLSAGANTTIEFSLGTLGKVQFEPGPVATPFERRSISIELMLCQRYYVALLSPNVYLYFYSYNIATATPVLAYLLPVQMRAAPTLTIVGAWVTSNSSQPTTGGVGSASFALTVTVPATGAFVCQNTNAGTGLTLSAEL